VNVIYVALTIRESRVPTIKLGTSKLNISDVSVGEADKI
jgi:hypothetical protein